MTQITVSDHIVVEFGTGSWQLLRRSDAVEPKQIVGVQEDARFRYNTFFATTRGLPDEGEIPRRAIREVALRWSYKTEAWQLGIRLAPKLAAGRADSFCEVLRFIDPNRIAYEDEAKQAGQALADALGKPFVQSEPLLSPPPEPIPLIPLPIAVGIWRLQGGESSPAQTAPGELQLQRAKSWQRAKVRQLLWYALLAVVYAWVAAATLSSDLALPNAGTLIPNPQLLPYLGIGIMLLLLGMIAYLLWQLRRDPDTIVISSYERSITARCGQDLRWRIHANNIQSIYVSELVKKHRRRPAVHHSEINLHLVSGRFQRVIVETEKLHDAFLPKISEQAALEAPPGVSLLHPPQVSTALQGAALHIATCLGNLPVWYDRRFK